MEKSPRQVIKIKLHNTHCIIPFTFLKTHETILPVPVFTSRKDSEDIQNWQQWFLFGKGTEGLRLGVGGSQGGLLFCVLFDFYTVRMCSGICIIRFFKIKNHKELIQSNLYFLLNTHITSNMSPFSFC